MYIEESKGIFFFNYCNDQNNKRGAFRSVEGRGGKNNPTKAQRSVANAETKDTLVAFLANP